MQWIDIRKRMCNRKLQQQIKKRVKILWSFRHFKIHILDVQTHLYAKVFFYVQIIRALVSDVHVWRRNMDFSITTLFTALKMDDIAGMCWERKIDRKRLHSKGFDARGTRR